MKQTHLLEGYRTGAVGADVTSVRCGGKWLPLGISVDAIQGHTLSIDRLPGEEAEQLKTWLEPILNAVDADAFKKVSDETGRRTKSAKAMSVLIQSGHDHSLETLQVSSEQALADLATLKKLIHARQPEEQSTLEQLYLRYAAARKPAKGRRFDIAYRCETCSWIVGHSGRV